MDETERRLDEIRMLGERLAAALRPPVEAIVEQLRHVS